MLEHCFTQGSALERHRSRLLGPYLDTFVAESCKLGYTPQVIRQQCNIVGHFSDWLERRRLVIDRIDASVVECHVRTRRRVRYDGEATTLRRFIGHLPARRVAATPVAPLGQSASEELLVRFVRHLTMQRRILGPTAEAYASFARDLLSYRYPDGRPDLRQLRAEDISAFVVTWTRTRPPGRAKMLVTSLRAFLRFLLQQEEVDLDLSAAVPSVASWRLAGIPKYLQPQEVERLLASCDRQTAAGRRDYAILVLLARLGVRAREVACLEIDDIDWRAGEVVVRGKGAREDRLPLAPEVGEALADYLRYGRPTCATRRVFLRARAPIGAIADRRTIGTVVAAAMGRAGLNPPAKGSHILRHSLATRMLGGGASLAEIALVLRHRSPQSTELYAKVDFASLRNLALSWPSEEGGR